MATIASEASFEFQCTLERQKPDKFGLCFTSSGNSDVLTISWVKGLAAEDHNRAVAAGSGGFALEPQDCVVEINGQHTQEGMLEAVREAERVHLRVVRGSPSADGEARFLSAQEELAPALPPPMSAQQWLSAGPEAAVVSSTHLANDNNNINNNNLSTADQTDEEMAMLEACARANAVDIGADGRRRSELYVTKCGYGGEAGDKSNNSAPSENNDNYLQLERGSYVEVWEASAEEPRPWEAHDCSYVYCRRRDNLQLSGWCPLAVLAKPPEAMRRHFYVRLAELF